CHSGETITFTVSGGGGSSFSAGTYATNPTNGNFSGVSPSIINPGTGYNGSAITVTAAGAHTCSGVTATTTFGKKVTSVILGNPGSNYSSTATPALAVAVGGGIGSGVAAPTASATIGTPPPANSYVTGISITNRGSGYTTPPTVSFSGGGGTGATAVAVIGTIPTLIAGAQTLTNQGNKYTRVPNVTITPAAGDVTGSGATAYATVDGVSGLTYGMVYQLTSLAVTTSGARAMTQMEVATPVRGLALTGALTLAGPQPVVDQLPNSSPFYVDGHDNSDGSNVGRVSGSTAAPVPPTCTTTPQAPHPAVGVFDDPNASVTPAQSSVQIVDAAIPSGRTNNYLGSGPSPDVENVFGALGDTMTTPQGMAAFQAAVQAQAATGGNVFGNDPTLTASAMGTVDNPAVTYVDGNLTLNGSQTGYGILLVTGTLVMGGNFSWNGLVLVIGDGNIQFGGGGNGQINGSVIAAKIWDGYATKNLLSEIGSPHLSWNGGGGNGVYYNHCWADDMLSKVPFFPPPPSKQLKIVSTRTVTY
ncbi:MAG TPA: hypothetical protein VIW45_12090, partial [Vicinamibacterales bacterium]